MDLYLAEEGAGLKSYLEFISRCKEFIEENPLSDLMEEIIKTSGLVAYHAKEPGEKGKDKSRKFRRACFSYN